MKYYINFPNWKQKVEGKPFKFKDINRDLIKCSYIYKDKQKDKSVKIYSITDVNTGMSLISSKNENELNKSLKENLEIIQQKFNNKQYIQELAQKFKTKLTKEEFYNNIEQFDKVFNLSFWSVIDEFVLGICNIIRLDLIKLDNHIRNSIDNYNMQYDNLSCKELIKEIYGDSAVDVINKFCIC